MSAELIAVDFKGKKVMSRISTGEIAEIEEKYNIDDYMAALKDLVSGAEEDGYNIDGAIVVIPDAFGNSPMVISMNVEPDYSEEIGLLHRAATKLSNIFDRDFDDDID